MNASLFASRLHAILAALLTGGFVAWLALLGAKPGAREGSDRLFVVVSGWASLVLMTICFLYVSRKYLYKVAGALRRRNARRSGPLGPESSRSKKLREKQLALERAENEIEAIKIQVRKGILVESGEVSAKVQEVLKRNRVTGLVKPVMSLGSGRRAAPVLTPAGGVPVPAGTVPELQLRLVPREPMGRMSRWLHSHFYYGLGFGVLVFLHGGVNAASPLGWAMISLSAVVIATGLLGMLLFARGPIWLTPRTPDLGLEQSVALTAHATRKIEDVLAEAEKKGLPRSPLKRILAGEEPSWGAETALLRDLAILTEQHRRFWRSKRRLGRIKLWMNLWRVVHVPASILLAVLVILHVLSVWWY